MNNIKTTQMSLNMKNCCNSADVVSTCNVGKVAGFVPEPLKDGIFLEVVFESITLVDFGVGVSDGSSVMGYDVGDLVGSNSLALDLQQFDLGLCLLDLDEGESSLNIVEHPVVLVGLNDGEDVHDTNGEFGVPPDFIINFNAGFSVLQDEGDLTVGECQLEVVSGLEGYYLMMIERGRHSLSLWGPWLGRVALIPPILERSHDRGVLILLRCFLGPLAIEYLSKNILLI